MGTKIDQGDGCRRPGGLGLVSRLFELRRHREDRRPTERQSAFWHIPHTKRIGDHRLEIFLNFRTIPIPAAPLLIFFKSSDCTYSVTGLLSSVLDCSLGNALVPG